VRKPVVALPIAEQAAVIAVVVEAALAQASLKSSRRLSTSTRWVSAPADRSAAASTRPNWALSGGGSGRPRRSHMSSSSRPSTLSDTLPTLQSATASTFGTAGRSIEAHSSERPGWAEPPKLSWSDHLASTSSKATGDGSSVAA
jgi:hypothetical protein